ncbi:MAG TPA: magnesium transporter CorA family protein [Baekduia sp.]|uniref:magnesium transporter CorA family protein n=1 Tax=Baekduia sp. TaxID=2600305 RepID=UPI002D789AA2|nr:magnesium transporter CorA family protein [Baekduia sp.]HET6507404.1 magnesium transporter CorA family protein [Baekduia sp.]
MPRLPRPPLRRAARSRADGSLAHVAEPDTPNVDEVESEGLRWINIERPRAVDRAWLEEHFDFHPLDYEDVFSRNQRPKVDEYPDYLFVVLHFPVYDKRVNRLNAAEVDIFVGPDFLITLPNEPLAPLQYVFDRCRTNEDVREDMFNKGAGYLLYKVIDACVDASFPMLRKMGLKLERLEEAIFEEEANREVVRDLSNAKQEIINFRKIVRPQRAALKDLERTKRYVTGELDIYFDDINDASERVWDMLENFKEVIEGLEATNESVLSHRLNDSIRVLTAFSVIMLPLTLIASVLGMNVGVPGEGSIHAFWVTIVIMLSVLTGMILWFRKRGWL